MFIYAVMGVAAFVALVWRIKLGEILAMAVGADRRRVHVHHAGHRLALGQADVGHLVDLGCAPDFRAGAAVPVSRRDRPVPRDRGSPPGRARRRRSWRIIGVVNVPIVHFSVNWWNTLHQGRRSACSASRTIDARHAVAAARMTLATKLYFVASLCRRARTDLLALEGGKDWVAHWPRARQRHEPRACSDFFAMGGYAAYVWPAYAVFLAVLLADTLAPHRAPPPGVA